jgi:ELWxxDGT repeat protein
MRLRTALIVMVFCSSTLTGCTGNDSEKDETIAELEAELSDSISDHNSSLEQISTLEAALAESVTSLAVLESTVSNLTTMISGYEEDISDLINQRDGLLHQLNVSEGNNSVILGQISALESEIDDLESQLLGLTSELAQKEDQIANLENTIFALGYTMSQLTHTIVYNTENCPLANPGYFMDIGFDDGQGLGVNDDGKVTYEEVHTTVGECPGDFGMVYNQTTREHDWAQQRVVEMGGVLYFIADDGTSGWELWRSDGTVSGSYIVKDIRGEECETIQNATTGEDEEECSNPSSIWDRGHDGVFLPAEIVAGEEVIFFTAYNQWRDESTWSAADLWVSDGTEEGTVLVRDLWEGWNYYCSECAFDYVGISNLEIIPKSGNNPDRVIFSAIHTRGNMGNTSAQEDGTNLGPTGEELFISDGTFAGTQMVANIRGEDETWVYFNGTYCCGDWKGSIPRDMVLIGQQVWFTAETDDYGRELYRYALGNTFGVGSGYYLVKDIMPGAATSNPGELTRGSGGLFLSADDGVHGQELHFSLGDQFTTDIVKDIWEGEGNSSNPMWLTKLGSKIVFSADDGANGRELWISDSTNSGTYMIKDINPGNNSSNPTGPMKEMDGFIYFSANDGVHGYELWRTDGTEAGTTMVRDIRQGENSSLSWGSTAHWHGDYALSHDGHLYFSANDGENGEELWRTDGTEAGTNLIVDANPGETGSWPWWITSLGDKIYFTSWDGNQRQLWHYWDNPGPVISV